MFTNLVSAENNILTARYMRYLVHTMSIRRRLLFTAVNVQRVISHTFHLLGGSKMLFGYDAAVKLEATRREKMRELSTLSGEHYLLSFPRSGNHWCRFILEFFSGMPTKGLSSKDRPIYRNLFKSALSPLGHVWGGGGYYIYKTHNYPGSQKAKDMAELMERKSELVILLIRDYHECVRAFYEAKVADKKARGVKELSEIIRWYLDVLLLYERVGARKMYVYYEDLVLNPRETIASILAACGIDNPSLFEYFMRNYKRMQFLSRTAKNRYWFPSVSKDDIHYHKQRLDNTNDFNEMFQRIYSESRYDRIRYLIDHYHVPAGGK